MYPNTSVAHMHETDIALLSHGILLWIEVKLVTFGPILMSKGSQEEVNHCQILGDKKHHGPIYESIISEILI